MKKLDDFDYLFKYVMIGDTNVGKSSILMQFIEKRFKPDYDPTIGVEFGSKMLNQFSKNIKLQIWDTAGQESFRSITRSYYRNSIGAVLVYDITKQDSFTNIKQWLSEVKSYSHEKINIMMIGNKTDLSSKLTSNLSKFKIYLRRQVSKETAEQFAQENNIHFMETSAKIGTNIQDAFLKLTKHIMEQIQEGQIDIKKELYGIKVGAKKLKSKSHESTDTIPTDDSKCKC